MLPFSGNVYLNLFYLSHAQVEYGELIKHKKDFLLRSKKFLIVLLIAREKKGVRRHTLCKQKRNISQKSNRCQLFWNQCFFLLMTKFKYFILFLINHFEFKSLFTMILKTMDKISRVIISKGEIWFFSDVINNYHITRLSSCCCLCR